MRSLHDRPESRIGQPGKKSTFQDWLQSRGRADKEIDILPALFLCEDHIVGSHQKVIPNIELVDPFIVEPAGYYLESWPVPDIGKFDRSGKGVVIVV